MAVRHAHQMRLQLVLLAAIDDFFRQIFPHKRMPAKQPVILKPLEIGQIAQCFEAERREKMPGRHIGVGRAVCRAARAGAEKPGSAKAGNHVAAYLLAEHVGQL